MSDRSDPALARWPVHPVLFAAFPVLFLWAHNRSEVYATDAWGVLAVTVGAVVAAAAVAALLFRNLRRGALAASIAAVLFLSYGQVAAAVHPAAGVTVLLALCLGGVLGVRAMTSGAVGTATRFCNVLAVFLVTIAVVPLAADTAAGREPLAEHDPAGPGPETSPAGHPLPDIYFIVLDRYGRADSLQEVFGYDNDAFIHFLEGRGFDVASQSLANYPKTAHSLASTLHMDYLDPLEDSVPDEAQDRYGPVYELLGDHEVGRILTEAGYRYLHLGTWWDPTASSPLADEVLTYDQRSEFAQVFTTTTALPAVQHLVGRDTALDRRELRRRHSEHQLQTLQRLAAEPSAQPRFVFAHITLPHEPYVFDVDGSFVPAELERERTRADNYTRQLRYLNRRLETIVEGLLDNAPPGRLPVVILQGDEGPTPVSAVQDGWDYAWLEAPPAELREKFRILNAYHLPRVGSPSGPEEGSLPGVDDDQLPEDITPVNTFRLVLRHYLGADLPPLPDRVFVYPERAQLYRFHDITERVRD